MLTIIHGKVMTMAGKDYEDGFVRIEHGKITALGDMADCPVKRWRRRSSCTWESGHARHYRGALSYGYY